MFPCMLSLVECWNDQQKHPTEDGNNQSYKREDVASAEKAHGEITSSRMGEVVIKKGSAKCRLTYDLRRSFVNCKVQFGERLVFF